jgi:outer membrane protein TolC
MATAERNLDVSIARYRAGEAPILEVTDAQTTLIAQRTAYYQALFDYQSARARLAQAIGQ